MPDFDANDGFARLPGAAPGGRLHPIAARRTVARYLDVVVVLVATPVALVLGAPALGVVIGSAAWIAQRVLAQLDRRWIDAPAKPRPLGVSLVEAFGRIWLLAGAIVIAAVAGGRADGLAASVMIFVAYSVAFALRVLDGRPGGQQP
jgi:hypothetical protein